MAPYDVSNNICQPYSVANDLALLMARLFTGSHDIIALRNAYHGMSPATMGLTAHAAWKFNVPQGAGGARHTTCLILESPITWRAISPGPFC
jgi:4-aminobutyrate aminotransferase-like enzyme